MSERPQDPIPPEYQDLDASEEDPDELPQQQPYPAYPGYPPGYPPPYPPPYPGYHGYPPMGLAPPSNIGWAVTALILFWPVGIPAMIKATKVDRYWLSGQPGLAEEASRTAKTLGVVAIAVAVGLFVLWLVLFVVLFSVVQGPVPAVR